MVKILTIFFLFFKTLLYSNDISSPLFKIYNSREIVAKHTIDTEHFKIFWSEGYPKNNIWLTKKEDLPLFIYKLKDILEDSYDVFLQDGMQLPDKIYIYLLNSDLKDTTSEIKLNNISSYGAFLSHEYPEVLINANIDDFFYNGKFISFNEKLKYIVLHELMHVYQYKLGLITKEYKDKDKLWLIEGLAVAYSLYYYDEEYNRKTFVSYLSNNINKGFLLEDDYYLSYTSGLFFKYLIEKNFLTFNQIYENIDFNKKKFLYKISELTNKNILELFYDFYKDLNTGKNSLYPPKVYFGGAYIVDRNATFFTKGYKPKNLLKNDYFIGDGLVYSQNIKDINLTINKGWNIYILNSAISIDELEKIDGIIWKYKAGEWSCRGNEKINRLCEEKLNLIEEIESNEGFWIFSKKMQALFIRENFNQKDLFYKKGWNLSGNILSKVISFDKNHLVWSYKNNSWHCSYLEEKLNISHNQGYWIDIK